MQNRMSLQSIGIVGVTLLASLLGGSTELWAQAIVIIVAATLMAVYPPRRALDTVPLVVALLLVGIALSAFLPVGWGWMPSWRHHLQIDLQAPLGELRTPQPWLTGQACGLFVFGIVWSCYLMMQEWRPSEKSHCLRVLASGVILLALVSVLAFFSGYRVPGWTHEGNRGWFPNRNQTADVLAVSGIVAYAIASKRLEKRAWSSGFWLVGLVIIGVALVVCYSRAGVILFFLGIALWQVGGLFRPKGGKQLAFGVSALLFLLSLFFLFGGKTFERFVSVPESAQPHGEEYRVLIQQDALKVSWQMPFLGVGLGNFEPVFTSMREASADQNRTLHPESDWLWMAVEMGWGGPLLILIGIRWWLGRCLPFLPKSGEALRRAAMVAAVIFLIHGFVDVSGHRLGSAMVGLLLASLALSSPSRRLPRGPITALFRFFALLLLLLSCWWLASYETDKVPPTTATLAREEESLRLAASDGRLASMAVAASAALEIAPLNWTYYFRRANAEAFRAGATEQAANDFQIARFLEPHWIDLCLDEGEVWLGADQPQRCLEAWREALRRAGTTLRAPAIYTTMLDLAHDNSDVREGLKEIAVTNADDLIAFLDFATPEEVKEEIDALLAHDPGLRSLNAARQKKLFAAWYNHGNRDDLMEALLSHADWQTNGWKFLAEQRASLQDFQMACLTVVRYMPPPVIPSLASDQPLAGLESSFQNHPHDLAQGVVLCQTQIQAGQTDNALSTISTLTNRADCPPYLFYLEAQLEMKKGQWEQAWQALKQFGI